MNIDRYFVRVATQGLLEQLKKESPPPPPKKKKKKKNCVACFGYFVYNLRHLYFGILDYRNVTFDGHHSVVFICTEYIEYNLGTSNFASTISLKS